MKNINFIKDFKINSITKNSDDKTKGVVSGIANKVEIIDHHGDLIKKGAFDKSINDKATIYALLQHKHDKVIGLSHLSTNEKGDLLVEMELNLDTQLGKDTFTNVKKAYENNLEPMFSIGGRFTDHKLEEIGDELVRVVNEVVVKEVSLVLSGANQEAFVNDIKSKDNNLSNKKTKEALKMSNKIENVDVKKDGNINGDTTSKVVDHVEKNETPKLDVIKKVNELVEKKLADHENLKKVNYNLKVKDENEDEIVEKAFFDNLRGVGVKKAAMGTSGANFQGVLPLTVSQAIVRKIEDTSDVFSKISKVYGKEYKGLLEGADISVGYTAENAPISETTTGVSEFTMNAHSLKALIKVSNELMEWSTSEFKSYLIEKLTKGFAKYIETMILQGSGTSPQPFGLAKIAGIPSVTSANKGAITATEVEKLIATLPANAENGSSFIMAKETFNKIVSLKDSTGNYIFRDIALSNASNERVLKGYPVILSPHVDALSAGGKVSVIFGNLGLGTLALIGRANRIETDNSVFFANDQKAIRGIFGFDFKVTQNNAFVVLKNKA